jgi:predicted nucleic acid-binding protein
LKSFFDTSVLLPAFMEDHEHHAASLEALLAVDRRRGCCAAHSLAEVYASFTRLPGKHRLSGKTAVLIVREIRDRLSVVSLDADEYYTLINEASAKGILGGTIYDALLAHCALKAKADTIYTWNLRHFQQFGPEVVRRIRKP